MKPRTVCFCQPIFCIISVSVAPCLRCSIATTWADLEPPRFPVGFSARAGAVLALGAFFEGVAFLLAWSLEGASWAAGAPPLAFFWAFGLTGSATGWTASPNPWMLFQILLTPAATVLNFFTGLAPGKLL